jgi:para-aminobenzoate synthetase component I
MNRPFPIPQVVRCSSVQCIEVNVDDSRFLSRMARHAKRPYSAVLLSGGTLDCSRYSIAAADPFLVFRSKGRDCMVQTSQGVSRFSDDPLAVLDHLCDSFKPDSALPIAPFSGGAVGYLSYDLKNQIEQLPQHAQDNTNLPDILMFWPSTLFIQDRADQTLVRVCLDAGQDSILTDPEITRSWPQPCAPDPHNLLGLKSTFTREEYLDAVEKVRTYIRNGDVYQVNLSQRFEFPFDGDPFGLWTSLFQVNPAPFYAYLQAGDHQVLSTSMERFLYRRGPYVETRPIKGTRKRGETEAEDRALRQELIGSPKDDAELSMIVDLLRNDLGRVCEPRSVRVAEHKRLEAYQNVYHLVSTVTGTLGPNVSHADLIRATFPGGSITGCPKIRAMEIIDEIEPIMRHVYTGSIGYLGWHDNLDLNIAIRTAVVHQRRCMFSVGGGIVYDSDPADEYEETLHKGRTFLKWYENTTKGGS